MLGVGNGVRDPGAGWLRGHIAYGHPTLGHGLARDRG